MKSGNNPLIHHKANTSYFRTTVRDICLFFFFLAYSLDYSTCQFAFSLIYHVLSGYQYVIICIFLDLSRIPGLPVPVNLNISQFITYSRTTSTCQFEYFSIYHVYPGYQYVIICIYLDLSRIPSLPVPVNLKISQFIADPPDYST